MVKREYYKTREDGVRLFKHYSDEGKYILQVQTGAKYDEAIDVEFAPYTYVETELDIAKEEAVNEDY